MKRKLFSGKYYPSQESVIRPGEYEANTVPAVFHPQKMTEDEIKKIAAVAGLRYKLTPPTYGDYDWGEVTFY